MLLYVMKHKSYKDTVISLCKDSQHRGDLDVRIRQLGTSWHVDCSGISDEGHLVVRTIFLTTITVVKEGNEV